MKRYLVIVIALASIVLFNSQPNCYASQPSGISLNPNGVSTIYPPFDTTGWTLTQYTSAPGSHDHNGDDNFANDWARGCGQTAGQNLFAGITGLVVYAGWSSIGYGNTVVLYDSESLFALRYAHLDTISVSVGTIAVAGITRLGTVGNTGNTKGSCASSPGAHLHIVLYKNVADPNFGPVTQPTFGDPATQHAALFGYQPSQMLIKGSTSPTVFVYANNAKYPVSAFVFANQGWGFTTARTSPPAFTPVYTFDVNLPIISFWVPRDRTLVRGANSQTVFDIQDGAKEGVTADIFSCRGFNFGNVNVLDQGEVNTYASGPNLSGCIDSDDQGRKDMLAAATRDWRFTRQGQFIEVLATTFFKNLGWSAGWELRGMTFRFTSGRMVILYQATSTQNRALRYTEFFDPDINTWTGWVQAM